MDYRYFLELINYIFSGITYSGNTFFQYTEICMEDEIELNPDTIFPSLFITPLPIEIINQNRRKFGARLSIAMNFTSTTERYVKINDVYNVINIFIDNLPPILWGSDYPINITPFLFWDNNIEGCKCDVYFNVPSECQIGEPPDISFEQIVEDIEITDLTDVYDYDYKSFVEIIKGCFDNLLIDSVPYIKYSEICMEDEIELNPETIFPSLFITPLPIEITDENKREFGVRIKMATNHISTPNRYKEINEVYKVINYITKILPKDYVIKYPLTLTPFLLWDNDIDGITFDIYTKTNSVCLSYGTSGEVNVMRYNGTSGSSGSSGKDGETYGTSGTSGVGLNGTSGTSGFLPEIGENYQLLFRDTAGPSGYNTDPEIQVNYYAAGGQKIRIESSTSRYGLAVYNSCSTSATGLQFLATGDGVNYGLTGGAKNGTSNYAIRIANTYPDAGANNWALYSDSSAKSYFKGNIGIGITNPNTNTFLQIDGNVDAYGTYPDRKRFLRIRNTAGYGSAEVGLSLVSKSNDGANYIYDIYQNGNNEQIGLRFSYGNDETGTTTNSMFLSSTNGYMGLNTVNPQERLHIYGVNTAGLLEGSNIANLQLKDPSSYCSIGTYNDGTLRLWANSSGYNSGSVHLVLKSGGNVGINTANPQQMLHINGGTIQIVDSNQGVGKVFTSDANGVGSWQTPSTGSVDEGREAGQMLFWDGGSKWTQTETEELFWDDTNKRQGVGTSNPAGKLHINGDNNYDNGDPDLVLQKVENYDPFIKFLGSEDSSYDKNISSVNLGDTVDGPFSASWKFHRMVKVEIGDTECWMPTYVPNK